MMPKALIFFLSLVSVFLKSQISTTCVPSVSIAISSASICIGESATYTVSGAVTYTFNTNPVYSPAFTSTTGVVTPTTNTSYQVSGTNQFGCTSSTQQIIFVNQLPPISIAPSPSMVCVGYPSTLTANAAPNNTVHVYNWAHGGISAKTVVNPTIASTYTVTGTNTITFCQNIQSVLVNVFHPAFTAVSDTSICIGNSITLSAGGAPNFSWTGGPTPGFSPFYIVSPTTATIYSVSVTSVTFANLKCTSTKTILVGVNQLPTVTAVPSLTNYLCPGQPVSLYAKGANSYYWPSIKAQGDTVEIATPVFTTKYPVIGTDLFGCKDTFDLIISRIDRHCGRGVNELQFNPLFVFPNPASVSFLVDAPGPIRLKIHNVSGVVVKEIEIVDQGEYMVDADDLSPGIYFLIGHSDNRAFRQKVIIMR